MASSPRRSPTPPWPWRLDPHQLDARMFRGVALCRAQAVAEGRRRFRRSSSGSRPAMPTTGRISAKPNWRWWTSRARPAISTSLEAVAPPLPSPPISAALPSGDGRPGGSRRRFPRRPGPTPSRAATSAWDTPATPPPIGDWDRCFAKQGKLKESLAEFDLTLRLWPGYVRVLDLPRHGQAAGSTTTAVPWTTSTGCSKTPKDPVIYPPPRIRQARSGRLARGAGRFRRGARRFAPRMPPPTWAARRSSSPWTMARGPWRTSTWRLPRPSPRRTLPRQPHGGHNARRLRHDRGDRRGRHQQPLRLPGRTRCPARAKNRAGQADPDILLDIYSQRAVAYAKMDQPAKAARQRDQARRLQAGNRQPAGTPRRISATGRRRWSTPTPPGARRSQGL